MNHAMAAEPPHVLIVVQNLPVPLDRRVWLQCQALTAHGYSVSVICPKGPGEPGRQQIAGVNIYKYAPAPEAAGFAGYAWEFAYSWLRTAQLSLTVWRHGRFAIMQACNPPDTYWLLAVLWRFRGVKFIFDHHDLNPELFVSRFGFPQGFLKRLQYAGLCWLERRTLRTADRIISTNESYKGVAVIRGGRRPEDVTVVRSGPDTRQMRPIYPETPRPVDEINLVYLGIMGPQDGVDQILLIMEELVHNRGRSNVTATLLGFGDCLDDLKRQSTRMGLDGHVTFVGRVDRLAIAEYLSRADIGLCPDLKTPLNDVSTMNKTMEYMAYGLPAVSFDLSETRVSGHDALIYAPSGDIAAFADSVEKLIDHPEFRVELGMRARKRVTNDLDWRPQKDLYVSLFNELSGILQTESAAETFEDNHLTDERGRRYVDLANLDEFARFIEQRRAP